MSNKYIIRSGAEVIGSGSSVFKVQGDSGTLIDVQDSLTGNIFSVTDSSSNSVFDVSAVGDANLTGSLTASAAQIAGLKYPTSDGTNGQLLTTDGSGNLSFNAVSAVVFPFSGDAVISGSLEVTGSGLTVTGAYSQTGNMDVTGQIDASGAINAGGQLSGSALSVTGAISGTTISGNSLSVTGNIDGAALNMSGQLSGSSVSVTGAISGTTISGTAISGASLSVTGIVSGSSADLSGAVTASSAKIAGLTYPTSDGTAGHLLKTDGAGNLSFAADATFPFTGDAQITGSLVVSGSSNVEVYGSGSSVFKVTGTTGLLFDVNDSNSGDILSVTDANGDSLFDVHAAGGATLTGSLNVSGSVVASGDIQGAAISGDSLSVTGAVNGASALISGVISGSSAELSAAVTASRAQIAGINFPASDGTSGQVIITDGAGNLTFSAGSATVFPFSGDAQITGSLSISGSGLSITGDHTQTGNIDVTGQIDASGAINAGGQLSGSALSVTGAISGTTVSGTSLSVTGVVSGSSADLSGAVTASSAQLGGITYPTVDGSAGHLLKTDGSGNLFFQADATFPFTGDAQITGSLVVSGSSSVEVYGSGSSVFKVTGTTGTLLDVNDASSTDILSVQDSSSNDIFAVHSAGGATVTGSLNVTGSVVAVGNLQGAAISGDSLSVTGNIDGAALNMSGQLSGSAVAVTGNISGGAISGTSVSVTGAVEGASTLITGVISGSSAELSGAVTASRAQFAGINFPAADGVSGQVIITDGAGNLTFSAGSATVFPFSGNAQITGSLSISGSGLSIDGDHTQTGNVDVTGQIDASGAINAGGLISGSGLSVTGAVTASSARLGGLTYPTSDGSAGHLLKTDGSGNLFFQADATFPFTGDAQVSGSLIVSGSGLTIDGAMEHTGSYSVNGDINIKDANLSYQANTDIDSAAPEVVASLATADFDAMFFDFVVKKGTALRAGTIFAVHDGSGTVRFNEVTTADHGDTSDVAFTVEVNGGNMELKATVASDDWTVKSLVRGL